MKKEIGVWKYFFSICSLLFFIFAGYASGNNGSSDNDSVNWLQNSKSLVGNSLSGDVLVINRDEYKEKLRGFWLGECIANWTGLKTEGQKKWKPYYTDTDWQTNQGNDWNLPGGTYIDFVLTMDPWGSDDDTDVEYMYQHLLYLNKTSVLTAEQIRDGWLTHMWSDNYNTDGQNFLWCSNENAYELMADGMLPPDTSLPQNNDMWEYIDAQLTTEIFGLFAPGRMDVALKMSNLPIRTSAYSHSQYAAEFYVVMHSLASYVDPDLPVKDQLVWLADQARLQTPGSSYIAIMYDWIKNEYKNNPDKSDWEATRDKFHDTFIEGHMGDFTQISPYDCGSNFGASIISLLYGEGDLKKTIKIGTLCGWDSDNPTATWGGLLGFIHGYNGIEDAFEKYDFSDRFKITRTRRNFPDYLPADSTAEDTLALMAERALEIIDRVVVEEMGGSIENNQWVIPAAGPARFSDGNISPLGTVISSVTNPIGGGNPNSDIIRDNFSPVAGNDDSLLQFDTYDAGAGAAEEFVGYTFSKSYDFRKVVFTEGKHYEDGGWFGNGTLKLQVLQNGVWNDVTTSVTPLYPNGNTQSDFGTSYETYTFTLNATGEGVRLYGTSGGSAQFISISELKVYDDQLPEQTPYKGTAFKLPGIIEVEDYDLGGQGVAYSDTNEDNEGGAYRPDEGVDLQSCDLGGYNVGWNNTGEWLEYTVDIEKEGLFDIRAQVASFSEGGWFTVDVNAVEVADFQFDKTDGWQKWETKIRSGITLQAGVQILRINIKQSGFNLNSLEIHNVDERTPYNGTPLEIPGTIEVEEYDMGGQGVAYSDNNGNNEGGAFRSEEGVDLQDCDLGGYNLGWTATGEWLEYTVDIDKAGAYSISAKVASLVQGGKFSLEIGSAGQPFVHLTDFQIQTPNGWQVWSMLTRNGITLSAGLQIIRINITQGDINIDSILIEEVDPEAFTFVVVPDTQYMVMDGSYEGSNYEQYMAQTQWIANNKETLNIKFVAHVGDVIENAYKNDWGAIDYEFKRFKAGWQDIEDAGIPWSIVPGNHDSNDNMSGRNWSSFNAYFSASDFLLNSWAIETYPDGKSENTLSYFEASGKEFMVLSLAYNPTQDAVNWAGSKLKSNPDKRAIISTHDVYAGPYSGVIVDLAKQNNNVLLIVSGHYSATEWTNVYPHDNGGTEFCEIMTDYQHWNNGYLRYYIFSPNRNGIKAVTYRPIYDEYRTGETSHFAWQYNMDS